MHKKCSGLMACVVLLAAGHCMADTLIALPAGGTLMPSQSWVSSALGQTPPPVTGTGVNNGGPIMINDLSNAGAGAFFFSQFFTSPQGSFAGANQINGNNIGFVTSYVFNVSPSMASAFVFSLDLNSAVGLENLTARLYEYNAGGITNLTLGGTGPLAAGSMMNWSTSVNSSGAGSVASTSLAQTLLANGGEFVLEIAGVETGSSNGALSGQLDVTPVPLPAALPLLLSGLGLLGVRRRRRSPAFQI